MIETNEMIRRLNQIENELVSPLFKGLEWKTDLDIGFIVGEMEKTISFGRRMVARLINDIEDEAERDRIAEEKRKRELEEYRRQRDAAKALEDGPGGDSDV